MTFSSRFRKITRRLSVRPRLSVEPLETRMLLDVGASNVLGGLNNATFNTAPQSIGLTLPPTPGNTANSITPATVANVLVPLTQGALAAPLAQNQLYDQFRLLAVNSQGQGNQPQVFQQFYFMGAFGFGSGTQPNQPWVPNAYNLGLANGQWAFPSQSDFGSPSLPPWTRPLAHLRLHDNRPDTEQVPETVLVHLRTDDEPTPVDCKADHTDEDLPPPAEQVTPPADSSLYPERTAWNRGDAAVEEALFSEDMDLPDPLWLSALAPTPVAAVVMGLPGLQPSAEGGEISPEGGAAE
jgi:hypothetical protein